ncbi:MAG: hypothetical protein E7441_02315 [Ruminococcaceae bacterium]|nr:hypothetical protein [Oscillospiraceae bacterium]
MKKKIISLTLSVAMFLSVFPTTFATGGSLTNFKKKNTYVPGQFSDVAPGAWYENTVASAYETGLIKGSSETSFNPNGNITMAESLALASRIHNIYNGGSGEFTQGSPWYKVYVDYVVKNDIYELASQHSHSQLNANWSRENFIRCLSKAIPEEELNEINSIPDGSIPDVFWKNDEIYSLYRAGIITGNDEKGTFNANSPIKRCEVATIVARLIDKSKRVKFSLSGGLVMPDSITIEEQKDAINIGNRIYLHATVLPDTLRTNKTLVWSSDNPTVASVDDDGDVTGLTPGEANITATTVNGLSYTVRVKVMDLRPKFTYDSVKELAIACSEAGDAGIRMSNYLSAALDDLLDRENIYLRYSMIKKEAESVSWDLTTAIKILKKHVPVKLTDGSTLLELAEKALSANEKIIALEMTEDTAIERSIELYDLVSDYLIHTSAIIGIVADMSANVVK